MITPDHLRELHQMLIESFDPLGFEQLLERQLSVRLERIVARGSYPSQVFEVIQTAERAGWTADLVRAAYDARPNHIGLARLYDAFGLSPDLELRAAGVPAGTASVSGFEAAVGGEMPLFHDALAFRQRVAELEARLCRVEVSRRGQSTGFLVGPDAVLTFSLMRPTAARMSRAIHCRFDSRTPSDGNVIEGTVVPLAADGMLMESGVEDLGFALLRLRTPVGSNPVGHDGPPRGWLALSDAPHPPTAGSMLIVPFYEEYGSLKLAIDKQSVLGVSRGGTHLRYQVSTSPGSAGAPCLTADFRVVAMHQSKLLDPNQCEGVLASAVRRQVIAAGHGSCLGSDPPPANPTLVAVPQLSPPSEPPPKPSAVVNADDPQKGRWGGKATKGGRKLSAGNLSVEEREFTFDAVVESTDGSPLEGPVIFHLHDTFAKSIIWVRKVENSQAVLREVNAYGAFTIGAQVQDKAGRWIGLEYDLVKLRGLPKRFHDI